MAQAEEDLAKRAIKLNNVFLFAYPGLYVVVLKKARVLDIVSTHYIHTSL